MPTNVKMRADSTGKLAVYTYDTAAPDDLPFSAPLSHLSRLRFHSDLITPSVVAITSYTVTLPAMADTTSRVHTYTLGPHGRSGTPMVMGRIANGSGGWIPLNGSVMLPMYALDGSSSYRLRGIVDAAGNYQGMQGVRTVALGADATNIVLHEMSHCDFTGSGTSSAFSLTVEVTVFDLNLDSSTPPGDGTDAAAIHMSASLIKAKRGAWRSDRRYIRAAVTGATHRMPLGKTIAFGANITAKTDTPRGTCHAGPAKFIWSTNYTDPLSFDAVAQDVKL